VSPHEWYVWLAAGFIAVVSVGRTARLLVWDSFPPVEWVRMKFFVAVGDSPWKKLAECAFCQAPYLSAGMLAWMVLSDLHWTWWLINGWWALSYLAAILVSYDQPADGTD
jgi:hypothetical protein